MGKKLSLAKREQLLSYKLIFPAFLVLVCIALFPIGQVVYTSLTNQVFASNQKTKFIGLNNYKQLLGLSFKIIDLNKADYKTISDSIGPQLKTKESFAKILGEKWTAQHRAQVKQELISSRINYTVQTKVQAIWQKSANAYTKEKGHPPSYQYKVWKISHLWGNKYFVVGAGSPALIQAFFATVFFTIMSVFLETVLGMIVALVINSNFRGKGIMRAVMLIPYFLITVVTAQLWTWILAPNRTGLLNTILYYLHIGNGQVSFLTSNTIAIPTLALIDTWQCTPFMALLFLAGLQMIPDTLYEAATVDGAGKFRQFWQITLPLLKPTIAVALIFRTLA
ncbi:MAG TPA: sugar ABC transporter permease [Victivallales bacterium]|nr:sugar ABC transporter permease [Victivallales bacterium]